MREFERQHLRFLENAVDRELVCEIGRHQKEGRPLAVKQVFLRGVASIATVQRRLRRLRQLGVIEESRNRKDRRLLQLKLSSALLRALLKYEKFAATLTAAP